MSMESPNGAASCSAINVTPLIDVLLVLLIIFMVLQPTTLHGLGALAPKDSHGQPQPADPATIVVQIGAAADGQVVYRVNGARVTKQALQSTLQAIFARSADRVLFVQGEPGLDYAAVLAAIDSGHAAGVDNIGILTGRID